MLGKKNIEVHFTVMSATGHELSSGSALETFSTACIRSIFLGIGSLCPLDSQTWNFLNVLFD